MRTLRWPLAFAIALVPLAACDEGTSGESAVSSARDSALARDLQLAGDSTGAASIAVRGDTAAVSESPGMVDSSTGEGTTLDVGLSGARNAANSPVAASPSAEGFIGPSCASPAREDQQRCLLGYLAKSDAALERSYQSLIDRLKTEAGTKAKGPEPLSVQRLRNAQRAWLVYRDDECRKRTAAREGPLWAPVRAPCLAEYSTLRARELDDALAKRDAFAPRERPVKAKRRVRKATARHHAGRG